MTARLEQLAVAVPRPAARLEPALALAVCIVAAVAASWRLLQPGVYSDDAFVHQYWMWQFRDAALFTDPLTAELRASARYPAGYEALFRLASQLGSPIVFGEWLGVALMALSGWLIFLIVREHGAWRPAAWIAAALFLALIDIHRFHGGFPRAFVHPVVLLTVLLALRRRHLAAALVAAGGALLYPPAAVLAVGVLLVCAVRWDTLPHPRLDRYRAGAAGLAFALMAAIVLGTSLLSGGAPAVLTGAQARAFPEFGERGPLHFFVPSVLEYLRQNRSGFDLREAGSMLAVAAGALLVLRPMNLKLLRAEVLALPVVSLAAWALAQAVLFRLYLPHRYTYPLVAFFAIAVGVALRPTWEALAARSPARGAALVLAPLLVAALAVCAFPLGPLEPPGSLVSGPAIAVTVGALALAAVVAVRGGAALGAGATGLVLLAVVLAVPAHGARGSRCPSGPGVDYLATLPKDAVIAGDPTDLKCLPATTRRAVVISTQLAPSYEAEYFRHGRARMFAMLRAYYGPSVAAIADLRARYGATHLWVRGAAIERELSGGGARWRGHQLPYGRYVRGLLRAGTPATLHLPAACRRWRQGDAAIYDIGCIGR